MWAHFALEEHLTRGQFAPRENLTLTPYVQHVAWVGEAVSSFGQYMVRMGPEVKMQELNNCNNP